MQVEFAAGSGRFPMASRRIPASAVVRHFQGDESCLSEVFFEGSDDELGMEDFYSDSDEETPGEYKINMTLYCMRGSKHNAQKIL